MCNVMQVMCVVLALSTISMLTSCSYDEEPYWHNGNTCSYYENVSGRDAEKMALGEELLAAVEDADIARVNFCLLVGADPNYKSACGISPLGEAISDLSKGPNPEIVKVLLERGGDPKAYWGSFGTTPFFSLVQNSTSSRAGSAVLSNQVACVKLLLKHGADPNRKEGLFRKSSLEYAVMREGDIELIKALIEGGAVVTDESMEEAKGLEVKRYLQSMKKGNAARK